MNEQPNEIASAEIESDPAKETSNTVADSELDGPTLESVPVDDSLADGGFQQLDPNFVQAEKIVWWITEAVVDSPLVVIIILAWVFGWFPDWLRIILSIVAVCLIIVLRFLAMRMPWWVFNTTSYSLSPLGMVIRRGIFWKREEHIPRSRIQHTDVTQGPIQRHFKIGTIVLHTAGTHNASVQLSGLNYERASRIRDYLIVGGDDDAV